MLNQQREIVSTSIVALVLAFIAGGVITVPAAQAQTFTVLHEFTGGGDGSEPYPNLVMDSAGNLYGTAAAGAHSGCRSYPLVGCGTVFKMEHRGTGWEFDPLYAFTGEPDGANPVGALAIAPDGTLYGTTDAGGNGTCSDTWGSGCGTVFHLQPRPTACAFVPCPWDETVLYRFGGGADGNDPWAGVVLDSAGDLYGTLYQGGAFFGGVAYELARFGSGWTESTVHSFTGGNDGSGPTSVLIFDGNGNLYGTTEFGGGSGYCDNGGCGSVFELTPSSSGWDSQVLYNFPGLSNNIPVGGVIFDPAGNLYGTFVDGANGIFELSPSNGSWNYALLYSDGGRLELESFFSPLTRDASGNLYGTSGFGGDYTNCVYGCGFVYKLTPSAGGWTFTQLYAFTGLDDGSFPHGGVVVDSNGNIYGTTTSGGTNNCVYQNCGVVWEITP